MSPLPPPPPHTHTHTHRGVFGLTPHSFANISLASLSLSKFRLHTIENLFASIYITVLQK